jgi:hypothetical protein
MRQAKMFSLFFDLPLELREDIYKNALSTSGPKVLQTCREMYAEARKFLYQRPLNFRNQAALYTWIEKTPQDLLAHVFDIALHIEEVNLKPILDLRSTSLQHRSRPSLLTLESYRAEVDNINKALRKVPNIKTLTFRTLPGRPSYFYREFVDRILTMSSTVYPNLKDLRLEGNFHHHELGFISNFQSLKSLSSDGFYSSSPAAAANILTSLQHLVSLSLISQQSPSGIGYVWQHSFTGNGQSLTGAVALRLGRLAPSSIAERVLPCTPSFFIAPDVLTSLHNHQTLKSLSMNLLQPPSASILDSLESFLRSNSIERLELVWPDLDPFVLERYLLLNESLRVVWVRARSEADAFEILWSLVERREAGELCGLRNIVLMRSIEMCRDSLSASTSCGERKDSGVSHAYLGYCSVSSLFSL